MVPFMSFLELAAGLVLLVLGGDMLVRGAVGLARRLGVSPLLIGLTLVGFGTSMPELVTSVEAALVGSPGIAVGNVVGSNIANILLILGLAALIRPVQASLNSLRRDGVVMTIAAIACAAVVLYGEMSRLVGVGLIAGLIVYLIVAYRAERTVPGLAAEMDLPAPAPLRSERLWVAGPLFLGGLALTVFGAKMLVAAAIDLAQLAGVSEATIGLTVVAIGTSLPELVTSVVAAIRRQGDVALGNILGSNIYNIFGILGVTAILQPIAVPEVIAAFDIWVMLAATVAMMVMAVTGLRVNRFEGGALLAGYMAYIGLVVIQT